MSEQPIIDLAKGLFKALDSVTETPDNAMFVRMATNRLHEFSLMFALANGEPWPIRKELQPLSNHVNEFFDAINKRLNAPLPDSLTEAELEGHVAVRDECVERLDAARIAALSMLVHLSAGIDMTVPKSANLKAV